MLVLEVCTKQVEIFKDKSANNNVKDKIKIK